MCGRGRFLKIRAKSVLKMSYWKAFLASLILAIISGNGGGTAKKSRYLDIVIAMLWRGFVNFLWYLLFIIPGVVKSYAYRMEPYILADKPNIGFNRALELSNQMTKGQKFRMFVLDLTFISWHILGILAIFVGVLFLLPYINATMSELYLVLRKKAIEELLCSPSELLQ
ncbi:DUF975 family protein [Tepidibacillus marianensis]|uniref:DUF975 family protein n=1 Tax=Tepidibacillus marianensis TaxID=3131995 RepID=UPI0030D56B3D